jgi:hypothetical protein
MDSLAPGSVEDVELVSQGQNLELERGSRMERRSQHSDKRNEDGQHRAEAYP